MNTLKPLMPLLFFLYFTITSRAVPKYRHHYCSNITINSTYQSNINTVLSSLSSNSSRPNLSGFYNASSGSLPGVVIQGLSQCRSDLSSNTCHDCVTNATTNIVNRCPNNTRAVIWYDECILHYSDQTILSTVNTEPMTYSWNTQNVSASERFHFNSFVQTSLTERASEAANVEWKFVAKAVSGNGNLSEWDQLYMLVQCTQDLSGDQCNDCLQQAISFLPTGCNGKINIGGRVLMPSCHFRYEVYLFYNTNSPLVNPPPPPVVPPAPAQSGNRAISIVTLVAIVAPIGVFILLFCSAYCFLTRRRARKRYEFAQEQTGESDITTVESLQYDLTTIKAATNNFSDANKLGEGGFGEVYKGTLANRQEIAVKRLSRHSMQGTKELKNEVRLVAKLQHRNLVRLLGFCTEGEEKILVYEFVSNKSLDYFLFDHEKRGLMDWSRCYKIIEGIGRGILYLHEDSQLKIIHRDLKASNILLDVDMNPKISDFGMARIFGVDQSQANTNRIVGTYGYMSPEYAMYGQFSVKSDIYSFGVLILEIITGKKNNSFFETEGSDDLVTYVWKHWRDGTTLEVLDPAIADTYSRNEVIRCIHIGLLCVQEDPMDRPTMASVDLMLNNNSVTLALPRQPPFFYSRTHDSIILSEFDQSKSKSIPSSVDENSITEVYP